MIGEQLGHYQILGKLGEGGWGAVYAALDTNLNREVALKLLVPERAKNPELRRRFQQEAKTIAALQHPNIVTLYSAEEAGDQFFLTMERVAGQTLSTVIQQSDFSLEVFLERAIALADALRASHSSGIVHRDIKPDNIMIDGDGRVRVLDFGLAKLLDSPDDTTAKPPSDSTLSVDGLGPVHTATGQILGTVTYMSPEQARGLDIDHRTDIFSLGAVLYEMATGKAAFRDTTVPLILEAILNRTPAPASEVHPAVPAALGRIIQKSLEKDRDKRYQSAADLLTDLEQLRAATISPHAGLPAVASGGPWRWMLLLALVAVAISALPFWFPGSDTVYRTEQLTSAGGLEMCPTWSPLGDRLAYSSTAQGPADIYVHTLGEPVPTLRAASEGDDLCATWSPDDRGIVFISGREALAGLHWLDAVEGEPRRLADLGFLCSEQMATVFQLLGSMPWNGPEVLFSKRDSGRASIWKVNVATGEESLVHQPGPGEQDLQASWSWDGQRIVFQRRGAESGIYVMDYPDGEPRPLLVGDSHCRSPVWSRDEKHVFFVSTRGGSFDVWRIDDDGDVDSLRQLTHEASQPARWPSLSQQGRVAYSLFGHQTDLRTVNLGAAPLAPQRVTTNTADNFGARFDPASTARIVFHSSRLRNHEIWLMDHDTDTLVNLTRSTATDLYPDFAPDGRIVFLSDRGGAFQLWVMNSDGTQQTLLSKTNIPVKKEVHYVGRSEGPRWSPDGRAVGYLAPAGRTRELRMIDPVTGASSVVLPGPVYSFDWYRDSNHVIYVGSQPGTGTLQLRAVDLRTGTQVHLRTDHCAEIAVARDGSTMTYCRAVSHFNMQLFQLDLVHDAATGLPQAPGPPRLIDGGNGGSHIHNGGLSPSGQHVVYTFDTDKADLFMLDPVK